MRCTSSMGIDDVSNFHLATDVIGEEVIATQTEDSVELEHSVGLTKIQVTEKKPTQCCLPLGAIHSPTWSRMMRLELKLVIVSMKEVSRRLMMMEIGIMMLMGPV